MFNNHSLLFTSIKQAQSNAIKSVGTLKQLIAKVHFDLKMFVELIAIRISKIKIFCSLFKSKNSI